MSEAPPLKPPTQSSVEQVVDHDLSCAGCGYNLRTLRVDSVCPECASPVVKSLPVNASDWLNAVYRGTGLLLVVEIAGVISSVVALPGSLPSLRGDPFLTGVTQLASMLMWWLVFIAIWGTFLATRAGRHPALETSTSALRWLARLSLIAGLSASVPVSVLYFAMTPELVMLLMVLVLAIVIAEKIHTFTLAWYLKRLLSRQYRATQLLAAAWMLAAFTSMLLGIANMVVAFERIPAELHRRLLHVGINQGVLSDVGLVLAAVLDVLLASLAVATLWRLRCVLKSLGAVRTGSFFRWMIAKLTLPG